MVGGGGVPLMAQNRFSAACSDIACILAAGGLGKANSEYQGTWDEILGT